MRTGFEKRYGPPVFNRHPRFWSATASIGVLLAAGDARAETEHTFQSWTAYFAQARLSSHEATPGIWADVQARRGEAATVFLFRPGVGWFFDRAISIWAGYLFAPTLVERGPDRHEHRPWQQFLWTPKVGAATLMLRTRSEQRWVLDEDEVGFRLRQFVRLQHPLSDAWAVAVWDEVFLGLNRTPWGQPAGLDQNRAFVGPAWIPQEGVRLEPGYLLAWIRRDLTTLAHALSVNCFMSF